MVDSERLSAHKIVTDENKIDEKFKNNMPLCPTTGEKIA